MEGWTTLTGPVTLPEPAVPCSIEPKSQEIVRWRLSLNLLGRLPWPGWLCRLEADRLL